ncbi:MAG: class I SAM-dependent methyltransferase [Candidatus Brocadiia bacterium]
MPSQVPPDHYFRPGYLSEGRMAAYAVQYREVMASDPDTVLEIGGGPGILAYMLQKSGVDLTTVDIDPALEPDVVASVDDLPFEKTTFDVVTAFEVLEHVPFEKSLRGLEEIRRVTKGPAIISLPDGRRCIRLRVPGVGRRKYLVERPIWRREEHEFDGEHYWEINKKGYPLDKIKAEIQKRGFKIETTYRPWHMAEHRFFRLRRDDGK